MLFHLLARLGVYPAVVGLLFATGQIRHAEVSPAPDPAPPVVIPEPEPEPRPVPDPEEAESGPDDDTRSDERSRSAPTVAPAPEPTVEIAYRWNNHHDKDRPQCAFSVRLPRSLIHDEIESFGLSARYSLSQHFVRGGYREKGFLMERAPNSFRRTWWADYRWMLQESLDSLAPVRRELDRISDDRGYEGRREEIGLAASLVQTIPFQIPPLYRSNRDGERFYTFGVKMPVETLHTRTGDCDSKSILLASLDAVGNRRGDTVMVLTHGHAFVGVADQPRPGELFVTVRGRRFVLLETTYPHPFGWISASDWQQIQHQQAKVVRLD